MQFDFTTASAIHFGPGRISEAGLLARRFGARALVVLGRHPERAETLFWHLQKQGVQIHLFQVVSEPTLEDVDRGVQSAREAECGVVIGMGGGSVLDAAKAVAALLTNPGHTLDYLEVIGRGKKLVNHSAPTIAIPTTAGTGAEVTTNAVLLSPENQVKVSLRSPLMIPKIALVDPLLTTTCPPDVTAASGLDSLTQLIEPFTCSQPNPLVDSLCRDGIERVRRSLRKAHEDGNDPAAREDMALAAMESGMSLANAKLGAVHGISAPLGGMVLAPHGAVCARLLPAVMEVNIRLLRKYKTNPLALERYTEIARILTGKLSISAEEGVDWVRGLVEAFRIHPLSQYGLKQEDLPLIAEKAQKASSMKGNPVPLSIEEIIDVLKKVF